MKINIKWVNIQFIIIFIIAIFVNIMNIVKADPFMPTSIQVAPIFIILNLPINGFFYFLFLLVLLIRYKEKILYENLEPSHFMIQGGLVIVVATIFGAFIDYIPYVYPFLEFFFISLFFIFLSFFFLVHYVQRIKMKFAFVISFGMCIVNIISWLPTILIWYLAPFYNDIGVDIMLFTFIIVVLFFILFMVLIFILDIKYKKLYNEVNINRRKFSLPAESTKIIT